MHPDIRHALRVEGAAGLRDLVLVMRKHEIDAAAMDVELSRRDASSAMAEHSMCQPGRPGAAMPAGDGQDGSPGFDGFHSTKSVVSVL